MPDTAPFLAHNNTEDMTILIRAENPVVPPLDEGLEKAPFAQVKRRITMT
jgi:hypothetical protein